MTPADAQHQPEPAVQALIEQGMAPEDAVAVVAADAQHQPPVGPVPPYAPDYNAIEYIEADDERPPRTGDPEHGLHRFRRPAETTAAASAVALLVARLLGVEDADTITALAIVIGLVPTGVTWLVETLRARP